MEVPHMFLAIHMEIIQWCELTRNRLKKGFLMYLLYWKSKWWFNSQKSIISLLFTLGHLLLGLMALLMWPQHPCEMSVHGFMLSQTPLAVIIPLSGSHSALMWVKGHIIEKPSPYRLISQCIAGFLPLDCRWMS